MDHDAEVKDRLARAAAAAVFDISGMFDGAT